MFIEDTNFLDQHFLIDSDIKSLFLSTCDITDEDDVVEIGPGKGTITKMIAPFAKSLTVIELDKRLAPYLDAIPNIRIIYDNVLKVEIPKCNKIVTSLPYSITEPFIYKLMDTKFDKLIMICGNKFALGVKNNDNTKLSILTNAFFKINYIKEILPSSFKPEPKVLSALITLEPKLIKELSKPELVMHDLFLYRYMKLKNALKEIFIKLNHLNQRSSRDLVNGLKINDIILDKKFDELSNEEVEYLFKIFKENM